MNFIKLCNSYMYLYSPKSWLHLKNNKIKLGIFMSYLICLPLISLKHVFLFLIILLCLLRSIMMPRYLRTYFYQSIGIFVFFLIINIKYYSRYPNNEKATRAYCILQANSFEDNLDRGNKLNSSNFYLPLSIIRIGSIHLIYSILIRCFLITTKHSSIIKLTLALCRHINCYSSAKFIFLINTSSQFLKIIFEEIEAIIISFRLRSIKINRSTVLHTILSVFISLLEQLLFNIKEKIFSIAQTLYSRDIKYWNLNTYS